MIFAKIKRVYLESMETLKVWAQNHLYGLFIVNLAIMILILLRSAGYFSPFFQITINFIVFAAIILSVLVLGLRSRQIFVVVLVLWLFSGVLLLLGIKVWAERSAVYMFEALIIGLFVVILENIRRKN